MNRIATTSFLDELAWRGLLHQRTADAPLDEHLATPGRVAYAGFDPTADSLHIGHFIPAQLLRHWQRAGHRPIVLVGGGTGLIGDPSGKDSERKLLDRDQVEANVRGQRRILERLLDFDPARPNAAIVVNNLDWLEGLGYLEMLRDVGKHFSVNTMIQKDSVRERLLNREQGISYTEMSYMILQAYDFLHLRRTHECTVQMAGSDQYGNIVSGIDLIRRQFGSEENQAFGVTAPLVTRSDGRKMGKTEQGAVWLTADRTSPYAFYQFWMNTDDADVVRYIRFFTFLEQEAVTELDQKQAAAPHERPAQHALAEQMTTLTHGAEEMVRVRAASTALFTGNVRDLDAELLAEVFADVPHTTHDRAALGGDDATLLNLLPTTSLASSKREARQFLANGAVSVNGTRADPDGQLTSNDLLHGTTVLLRRGKKTWHAMKWG